MVVDSNNQTSKRKKKQTLLVNLQSYLVLIFHFFEFFPQIFRRWSRVRVVFPTLCHYVIPEEMSIKNLTRNGWTFGQAFSIKKHYFYEKKNPKHLYNRDEHVMVHFFHFPSLGWFSKWRWFNLKAHMQLERKAAQILMSIKAIGKQ